MSLFEVLFEPTWCTWVDFKALRRRAQTTSRQISRKTKNLEARIEELEINLGEMALVCKSLLTVLCKSGTVDPRDLEAVMRRVDA